MLQSYVASSSGRRMIEGPADQTRGVEAARSSPLEKARTEDLLRIIPRGRRSVLDIGARDGHFSCLLTQYFAEVTALDLEPPAWRFPGVTTVAGDVTHLAFPDAAFDCVFCTEVLEHIAGLELACREIVRVARREIVIGVPFQQDIRLGRTTCLACGKTNPPWGHINSFTEQRLFSCFPALSVVSRSFVGLHKQATNAISARLMDWAGNPWGSYGQEEPCIHCGAILTPPPQRSAGSRLCSAAAACLNRAQSAFTRPLPVWIHVLFALPDRSAPLAAYRP